VKTAMLILTSKALNERFSLFLFCQLESHSCHYNESLILLFAKQKGRNIKVPHFNLGCFFHLCPELFVSWPSRHVSKPACSYQCWHGCKADED